MNDWWKERLRNLLWTVSGDYQLEVSFEEGKWEETPWAALYDAVKEGAFARFFEREELSLYLLKKIYLGAEEGPLLQIAGLCVDAAVGERMTKERLGVEEIRRRAYEELLEVCFGSLVRQDAGRLAVLWMKTALDGGGSAERRLAESFRDLQELSRAEEERALAEAADRIYNRLVDPHFERRRGGFAQVMAVTLEELSEFNWRDYLQEEALEQSLDAYRRQLENRMTDLADGGSRRSGGGGRVSRIQVSEEELKKRKTYTALNFGPSYLSEAEEERRRRLLCREAHADCRLYYTEGILKAPLVKNYQYQYARRQAETNRTYFRRHQTLARKSIGQLAETLKKALLRRNEPEDAVGDSGRIVPGLLWKVGRMETDRLFLRQEKREQLDFVVDILIDASGSQRKRQSQVAVQAYIISQALSRLAIPHRVMSFCSFWNTTILHRFRDYGDGPEANENIFELFTSSNNRDGLAIRAAAYDLLQQPQEGKVLIVLSDGRPNDRVIFSNGGGSGAPLYGDDFAVRDTAHEVRRVRGQGVSVLGVFAGEEEDLQAERRIFGKDFAYIRSISAFSHIAGKYLKQLLEEI